MYISIFDSEMLELFMTKNELWMYKFWIVTNDVVQNQKKFQVDKQRYD